MIVSNNPMVNMVNTYAANKAASGTTNEKQRPNPKTDEVVLSAQAQNFAQLLQQVRGRLGEARRDRTDEIARRLDAGTYRVDVAAVAARMVSGRS